VAPSPGLHVKHALISSAVVWDSLPNCFKKISLDLGI
jgi:hypothetical protein